MEVIRDPIWQNIWIEPLALRLVDTSAFQRLRRVKQLALAHLVYPGAVHTRFDHALGVYHLASRALSLLEQSGELARVSERDRSIIKLAGLLHDIGHYPFSHALEELDPELVPIDHEELAGKFLADPEVAGVLEELGPETIAEIHNLILGRSASPLQGLVSGSLDLDKLEYLKRDATFCGVPYGEIDVDRLLASLRVLTDPETGNVEIGVATQGVAALESLLFAKYQMFRNVYWHHGVRAATVTFQRMSRDALLEGWVAPEEVIGKGDEELLSLVEARAAGHDSDGARRARELFIPAIRHRRLPKRAAEWLGDAIRKDVSPWFHERPDLRSALEDHLAAEFALRPGELFLDYPAKPRMMELDILMLRKDGGVQRLTAEGYAGLIDLPRLSRDLYHAARVLRVFTFKPVVIEQPNRVIDLVTASQREVAALVSGN